MADFPYSKREAWVEWCAHFLTYQRTSWRGYCSTTALHGVRYIIERRRSLWERVFWMLSVAICFTASIYQIDVVYQRWVSSPDVMSLAVTSYPTWKVPFPAVSICPENIKQDDFDLVQRVCSSLESSIDASSECRKLLFQRTPPIDKVLKECSWNGLLEKNCSKADARFFSRVVSDQGICYTFNILNSKAIFTGNAVQYEENYVGNNSDRWTLENGYSGDVSLSTFPRRAIGYGIKSGLVLLMQSSPAPIMYDRFKIILHNPMELPVVKQKYSDIKMQGVLGHVKNWQGFSPANISINQQKNFHPLPNHEFVVTVTPKMMTASSNLHTLPLSRRPCYFQEDRQLHFFQEYSEKNCDLECESNFTVKNCGCALFHMPRSKNTPICASEACYNQMERTLRGPEVNCNCLPACVTLGYDIEVHQAPFDWGQEYEVYKGTEHEMKKGENRTRLSIFMKDTHFTTSERSVLYGRPEFLADCGGYLVLFNGFSIITVIEIMYYLTVRWCGDWQLSARSRRNN